MSIEARPVTAQELPDLLCGQWIDVGALDPSLQGTVVIPFGPGIVRQRMIWEEERGPDVFPHQFVVHNVARVTIRDKARIQIYDIVDASYDSESRELTLRSSFPFVLTLSVTEPSLEVRHGRPEEVT